MATNPGHRDTETRKQKVENRKSKTETEVPMATNPGHRIQKLENTPKEPQKLLYGTHGKIQPSS